MYIIGLPKRSRLHNLFSASLHFKIIICIRYFYSYALPPHEEYMLFFDAALLYIREFIALIGVLVITAAGFRSAYQLIIFLWHKNMSLNKIRLQFGNSVLLGLEFMVGADIVGSMVQPNYYNLGLLAILVLIRTILTYFLGRELRVLTPQERSEVK